MIINSKSDLDAAPDEVRNLFLQRLAAGIYYWTWENAKWVMKENTATLEQLGFTVADFPDAPKPVKPDYNPDEIEAQKAKEDRIAELKQLLTDSDYVALADYDKDQPELKAQRQAWRDEIRTLEGATQ